MNETTNRPKNPLSPLVFVALVVAYFDVQFYFFERQLLPFGLTILGSLAIFLFLFIRRSRYAWHAALIVFVLILPITLFLTYYWGFMDFRLTLPLAVIDIVICAVVTVWICRARKPYFAYLACKGI
jgi:hypothetical protein